MILIFGATGFIGLYTAEAFVKKGYQVLGLGRNKQTGMLLEKLGAEFLEFDITDAAAYQGLPSENVEAVIVLAGLLPANAKVNVEEDENAVDYFNVNVLGMIGILEYCRKNGIKKVIGNTSYSDVSGLWGKRHPITEDEPRSFSFTGDHAAYVISRNAACDLMEYYNQQHGFRCAWFRFPPVYGVGPHGTIYVNGTAKKSGYATFIDNAIAGRDIEIWGDPHVKRDLVYVKDVAEAYVKAVESENAYGLYNMTGHTQIDLQEQAETIIALFSAEKKSRIVYRPEKKNSSPPFLFSMDRAARDFGFVPRFDTFRKMMEDYKRELENGRWEILVESRRKD